MDKLRLPMSRWISTNTHTHTHRGFHCFLFHVEILRSSRVCVSDGVEISDKTEMPDGSGLRRSVFEAVRVE